jgi:hypothetical protein
MSDTQIPLYITLESRTCISNTLEEREVSCRVCGAERSEVVAVVQADDDGSAVVGEYINLGELGLPVRVLDRLMLLCFKLLRSETIRCEGSAAEWWMTDATRWLSLQLGEDAALVLNALRRHVVQGVAVKNVACVRVD